MKNRKKLIAKAHLKELSELRGLGVPIKKLLSEHSLTMTAPTLVRLLDQYDEVNLEVYGAGQYRKCFADKAKASLFPEWVKEKKGVQIQPNDWKYLGKFPKGVWERSLKTIAK